MSAKVQVACRRISGGFHVRCVYCRYDNYFKTDDETAAKSDASEHRKWHRANPNF
jgi:hypothetical protein